MSLATGTVATTSQHGWYGGLEFRTLAETIPALVFVTDSGGDNIYTNVQFQRFTGFTVAQLLGQGWLDVIYHDDRARALETWNFSCETLSPYEARYRFRRFDGNYIWHLVRGAPILDGAGGASRWVGSCTDVDELVAGISNKAQSETILAALGTSPDLIVYAKDAECRFIFANDATLVACNMTSDQIIGRTTAEIANRAPEAAAIEANDRTALAQTRALTFAETWTGSDGRTRQFSSTKIPLVFSDGSQGLAALSIDTTATHDREQRDAETIADLRNGLSVVTSINWVADANGTIIEVNRGWRDHSGLPHVAGLDGFRDIVRADAYAAFADEWAYAVTAGEIFASETVLVDSACAASRAYSVLAIPLPRQPGGAVQWYGAFTPNC